MLGDKGFILANIFLATVVVAVIFSVFLSYLTGGFSCPKCGSYRIKYIGTSFHCKKCGFKS